MQRNNLDTLECYIRIKHSLYEWPENSRRTNQFVSPLVTHTQAINWSQQMQENDPQNKSAYTVVKSRSVKMYDAYTHRVMIRLPEIKVTDASILQTAKDMQILRDFLNTYHPPLGHYRWRICQDFREGHTIGVGFVGPSQEYFDPDDQDNSLPVHTSMLENFSDEAKLAGFSDSVIKKFRENLLTDDSKYGCFYNFKPAFLPELLALAKHALTESQKKTHRP